MTPRESQVFVIENDATARSRIADAVSAARVRHRSFGSVYEMFSSLDPLTSGCVVMPHVINGETAIEMLDRIRSEARPLSVVALATEITTAMTVALVRAGAANVVEMPVAEAMMRDAIDEALDLANDLRAGRDHRHHLEQRLVRMTDSEREVLEYISEGYSNRLIALALGYSERTIEQRRARIYEKSETTSVAALVRFRVECEQAGLCERNLVAV